MTLTASVALVADIQVVPISALATVAAAIQKQVTRDFGPVWGVQATVSAFAEGTVPTGFWTVRVMTDIQEPGALGVHTDENNQPGAVVEFVPNWPRVVSHEVLELLADPSCNRLVPILPPYEFQTTAARVQCLVEVCDPCEMSTYSIDGVEVSDFYLPAYLEHTALGPVPGQKYSFTGSLTQAGIVLPGGYISFMDPASGEWFQVQAFGITQPQVVGLGALEFRGRTIRAAIDALVREMRAHAPV